MNSKQKPQLLLLENNDFDAQTIKNYLKEAGIKYDLFHKESLGEGINHLQFNPTRLVFLEINLPDSQGFKTINSYIERSNNTPFIVITNTNNEIIGNQAIKAGAQDFLVKGQCDRKIFGRSVRYALHRSKVHRELEQKARVLMDSKKKFMEAQEMARFGTWEMDLVSNEMKWSEEVFRIFSFQPGSLSPTLSDYLSYVHIEDQEIVEKFFDNLTQKGEHLQIEHRILIDGIKPRYLNIQGKLQVEEGTGKIVLMGSIQDITERKLSEKLIIEKNISNKTAKVQEEVLADLSFQIRTPLSSIVNLLFLLESTDKTPVQGNYLNDLKTSVDDLSLSVNNLLNFSVMVSDNVRLDDETFNIREFLQGTKNVVAIKAEKAQLKIALNIDEKLPEKIISDQKKLTQILYNLVDNAIKYNSEQGHVIISVSAEELGESNVNLTLSVEDNGQGMSQEKIAELMEAEKLLLEAAPEEDSNKKKQMGIAIVSKLTNSMNGTMSIKSKPGKGSVFSISVPVKTPLAAKHLQGDKPLAPLKILLVEDHFLNQMATKKILTNWSDYVSVDIAENGLVGVEKFREYGYDLILMDLNMPVMDGFESSRKIRESSQLPIIALTANSSVQEQNKCMELGMNGYLSKPFKPQELFTTIMEMMANVLKSAE